MKKPIIKSGNNWTFPLLEKIDELGKKYIQELGFKHFPLQIEIISPDQMLGLYTSNALPINYNHWSFGADYIRDRESFYAGKSGLAYEICKNTNPCLCYNMETNNAIEQASVIFHVYGHSSHFASNYLYRNNTDSDNLINYIEYARTYIKKCEDKYGLENVEHLLDLCHSLFYSSLDKAKRASVDNDERILQRELHNIKNQNYLLDKVTHKEYENYRVEDKDNILDTDIELPEENILYFIEKHSPVLVRWQRQIVHIIRTIAQFSYQNISGQSQIMAEGTAMFTECYIMKRAHEDGYIDEGSYIEYLNMNSHVLRQILINSRLKDPFGAMPHGKLNPYFFGLKMMRDIQRMCQNPTKEDIEFNSEICNQDWKLVLQDVISNYRDESFIRQFLSPKLIKDLRLMHVKYDNEDPLVYEVISHAEYYNDIREELAKINTIGNYIPDVKITNYEEGVLTLTYYPTQGRELHKAVFNVLSNIEELMGCRVNIDTNELFEA